MNLLYQWHLNDPVSQKEIDRNNAIFNYQGNRNPYIDFPEWVCEVWNVNNCTLSNDSFVNLTIELYPNPSNGTIFLSTEEAIDNIQIYSLDGQKIMTFENPIFEQNLFQISNLKNGFYLINLEVRGQIITKKIIVI